MKERAHKLLLTTSWDGGHPLDFRIAEMLERYGLKGNFLCAAPARKQSDEHGANSGIEQAIRDRGAHAGSCWASEHPGYGSTAGS
jgi:hypothetical protein